MLDRSFRKNAINQVRVARKRIAAGQDPDEYDALIALAQVNALLAIAEALTELVTRGGGSADE